MCGDEWHENHIGWGSCWYKCTGKCGYYIKFKEAIIYFKDTDWVGYYCKFCFKEKVAKDENEKESKPNE